MTPTLTIRPFRTPARGVARVPGSKSLTNRALIFAALAEGETRFTGALFSRDTRILIAALRELGFAVEADEAARTIRIEGQGGRIPRRTFPHRVPRIGAGRRLPARR